MDKVIKNITPLTYKFIGNESPYKAWPPLARYLHGASTFLNWNAYNILMLEFDDNMLSSLAKIDSLTEEDKQKIGKKIVLCAENLLK